MQAQPQTIAELVARDMVIVKGGAFQMGGDQVDERPVHRVRLPDFRMSRYPVMQSLWEAVMGPGSNPSHFRGPDRPVERVSWYDATVFCNALNEQCGYRPVYFSDRNFQRPYGKKAGGYTLPNEGEVHRDPSVAGYRLPTEAEWEYAARGGSDPGSRPRYEYAGGDKLDELGWYGENSHNETKPVGLKLPNELGLYDMSGNVWEWCEDQWHDSYDGAPADESAWVDRKAGPNRVGRGGAGICRAAYRYYWPPQTRYGNLGVRLVWFSPSV